MNPLKLKYKPSGYDNFSIIIYLGIGFSLLVYGIKMLLDDGDVMGDGGFDNWLFFGLSFYAIGTGLYKLYQSINNLGKKEIVLTSEKLTLPEKNSTDSNIITLLDISAVKIYDIFIEIKANNNTYTIDCSWIKNKKRLDKLVESLNSLNTEAI
ncbi:MAG: hypothetical protein QM503_01455 [Bacteroidota bacterium]